MKPLGLVLICAIHAAAYSLVVYGGENIYNGLGWMAAGIMLYIEVNT